MRRKVALYIAGQPVDLGEGSLLLFNYAKDDLDSPAAVKNSYTQKITLPGSERNNRIFGSFVRSDRETLYDDDKYSGAWFDPLRQTPFVLYREDGTIAESGYVKLEGVERKGVSVEYEVTLYGGLGSLLYGLTYNADGDRLTLADLAYTDASDPEHELDFTVGADAVRAAWARLGGDSTKAAMWDVINFAPCYNGIPSGDFTADRAVCKASDCGLPVPDGLAASEGGLVLVDLPQEFTEWQTRDLRSYLQRPAVRMRKIIEACCDPANNGGWEVELDPDFFNYGNPYWQDAWMTLPLLPDAQLDVKTYEGSPQMQVTQIVTRLASTSVSVNSGRGPGDWDVEMSFTPSFQGIDLGQSTKLYVMHFLMYESSAYEANYFRVTLEGLGASGRVMASASATIGTFDDSSILPLDVVGWFDHTGAWQGSPLTLHLQGADFVSLRVTVEVLSARHTGDGATEVPLLQVWEKQQPSTQLPQWHSIQSYGMSGVGDYVFTTPETPRSGVAVGKSDILRTEHTPADYLLSYCKTFGLSFLRHPSERKVSILSRASFYSGGLKDISGRVDLTAAKVTPSAASARWYEFLAPPGDGQFSEWYRNKYGREYGLQRVNTGYEFNSDAEDVTDGVVYAGGVTAQESSPAFADISAGDTHIPPVFVWSGATYTLYSDGEEERQDVPPVPENAQWRWYGATMQLDMFPKMQFHGSEGEAADGEGVLVFFRGMASVPQGRQPYALTDDTPDMALLNDGEPCWLLNWQVTDPESAVSSLPQFGRYLPLTEGGWLSLDFGVPAELAFPSEGGAVAGVYARRWADFFADRYETDSRVLTCRVDWTGYDVGEALFRNFYAFDGAVWALNRITDWSPETWDRTECEFIRVQDMENYK